MDEFDSVDAITCGTCGSPLSVALDQSTGRARWVCADHGTIPRTSPITLVDYFHDVPDLVLS
ncbi:hypothetical protein CLV46_0225 [Diaminobutyricimonas aerilata]|uniref:Uncharacterized protein n=1 Tax=Diaminobutyricimonas aerilata TaxID=1162967 RepID=A0A2M9CFI9_9MICO|nr:hypothetical protein [Diaminobutyricimonas aerilata]PJJ70701.1 hypothetical protein CLV46_0225 [Diaminobutyricimonas aerilata]